MEKVTEASRKLSENLNWHAWVTRWNSSSPPPPNPSSLPNPIPSPPPVTAAILAQARAEGSSHALAPQVTLPSSPTQMTRTR
jgi:hypothetical protein